VVINVDWRVLLVLRDLPHRLWMGLAHLQGRLVMNVLLTIVYFTLIWPLGAIERQRRGGSHPFHRWNFAPTARSVGWEEFTQSMTSDNSNPVTSSGSRSLIRLFVETLTFFVRRGHYLLIPVLVALLLLGLILFFIQTSVLAPFIYTI
jgi:hypothetical protein